MKSTRIVIWFSLLLGMLIWVADAAADYWFFYRGQSFADLVLLAPPPHELYIRLLIIVCFLAFGLVLSRQLSREKAISTDLERTVREKEILLRELHHRVKNNLYMIMSLVRLKANQASSDSESRTLDGLYSRLNSIALIHKHLYRRESVATVDLDVYIENLAHEVFSLCFSTKTEITLETEIEPIRVSLDTAVPCGLIVNELIQNSCKHAFPQTQRGAVRLKLGRLDRGFVLEVSDTGAGTDARRVTESKSTSLGLTLIEALTNQIDGLVEINTEGGFRTTITVPQVPHVD